MNRLYLVLLIIIIPLLLVIPGSVNGQQSNLTTITTQQNPPTPVLQTTQQIATEEDVFNQFLTSLGATIGVAGTGVGALWAKIRGKTKEIDQALRGTDFDIRDLIEIINSTFESSKKNPGKPLDEIIRMPAYKDNILLEKTIAQAWAEEYKEYMEWFEQRYKINKE